jgi:hypothetical protein
MTWLETYSRQLATLLALLLKKEVKHIHTVNMYPIECPYQHAVNSNVHGGTFMVLGSCALCSQHTETIDHLLVDYIFNREV